MFSLSLSIVFFVFAQITSCSTTPPHITITHHTAHSPMMRRRQYGRPSVTENALYTALGRRRTCGRERENKYFDVFFPSFSHDRAVHVHITSMNRKRDLGTCWASQQREIIVNFNALGRRRGFGAPVARGCDSCRPLGVWLQIDRYLCQRSRITLTRKFEIKNWTKAPLLTHEQAHNGLVLSLLSCLTWVRRVQSDANRHLPARELLWKTQNKCVREHECACTSEQERNWQDNGPN